MNSKRKSKVDLVTVTTTTDGKNQAIRMARLIVERRLAACVQTSTIQSVYRWKGKIESGNEFLLQAKTRASLAPKLVDFIKTLHHYAVPEITITPILGGEETFLDWVLTETAPDKHPNPGPDDTKRTGKE